VLSDLDQGHEYSSVLLFPHYPKPGSGLKKPCPIQTSDIIASFGRIFVFNSRSLDVLKEKMGEGMGGNTTE
jgi:hypothetical protein